MKLNYTLIFVKEIDGYSVSVLELPGCFSEGDTKKEALENIKEAIGLYLEGMSDVAKIRESKEEKITLSSYLF